MIQPERIRRLNDEWPRDGEYVLYWMQASQRAEWNHALEHAIAEANLRNLPVVALFGLTDAYPEANLRHYAFLLEGLRETQAALRERGIQLVVRRQSPDEAAVALQASTLPLLNNGAPLSMANSISLAAGPGSGTPKLLGSKTPSMM